MTAQTFSRKAGGQVDGMEGRRDPHPGDGVPSSSTSRRLLLSSLGYCLTYPKPFSFKDSAHLKSKACFVPIAICIKAKPITSALVCSPCFVQVSQ